MKSVVVWFVMVGLIAGGAGAGLYAYHELSREHAYAMELAELKKEFVQQSQRLAHLSPTVYRRDVGVLLTRYFRAIDDLAERFPEFYDPERERAYGQGRFEKGQLPQEHLRARQERIDLTLDLMDEMRKGQYKPLYTAADKGFRFDIYDIAADQTAGTRRIKLSYVHWGAHGAVEYKNIVGTIRTPPVNGKPIEIPQIVGEGQPPSLQLKPERWVREFIPGVEIGYYDLPLLPREASGIELSFDFGLRTVGGSEVLAQVAFPEIAAQESWKVQEGQPWQGLERLASDEDLRAAGGNPQGGQPAGTPRKRGGASDIVFQ